MFLQWIQKETRKNDNEWFEESRGNAVREDELVSKKESKKRKLMNSNFVLVLPSLFFLVPRFYRKKNFNSFVECRTMYFSYCYTDAYIILSYTFL